MANLTTKPYPNCTQGVVGDDLEVEYIDHHTIEQVVAIVVPILFSIIGLIGFVGNILVVAVVSLDRQMRSTTNLLIINLAIADLMFVIFCIPFTATDFVLPYWPFGNAWCKVVQYLIIVTACSSVYTLVLMSFDRYLAVVHPIASMSVRTERYAIIAISIVWITTLTSSIPVILIHGEVDASQYAINPATCKLEFMANSTGTNNTACRILPEVNWPMFQVSFFLVSYVVPLTLTSGLYVLLLLRLWKTSARVSAESRRGRKRVTRLVFVVVGVFAVCWFPIQVILVLKSLDAYPLTVTNIVLQIASHVLAYMNSCVNPILYAFLSENFRKAFRKVIWCWWRPDLNHRLGPMTKTTRAGSSGDIL